MIEINFFSVENNDPKAELFTSVFKQTLIDLDLDFYFHFPRINYIDIYFDFYWEKLKNPSNSSIKILFLHEPESVYPLQYQPEIINLFDVVVPIGFHRAIRLKKNIFLPFHPYENSNLMHPNHFLNESQKIDYENKIGTVMVNSNKFSALPTSNYRLRRNIAKLASSKSIDLYGRWNLPLYDEIGNRLTAIKYALQSKKKPDFRQALSDFRFKFITKDYFENKLESLLPYKFCIVVENESDWVTEKIFDAIKSGCIPIYIGPNLDFFPELKMCSIEIDRNLDFLNQFHLVQKNNYYDERIRAIKRLNEDSKFWSKISWKPQLEIVARKILQSLFKDE